MGSNSRHVLCSLSIMILTLVVAGMGSPPHHQAMQVRRIGEWSIHQSPRVIVSDHALKIL